MTAGRHTKPAAATRTWAAAAAVAAVFSLLVALALGGGGSSGVVPGLSDPGVITRWGLPIGKVALHAAAAVTVGLLLVAVLLPPSKRQLTGDALRLLHIATWTASAWVATAIAAHLFTLSDLVGEPIHLAMRGTAFSSFTFSVAQGQAYAAVIVLTLALLPATRLTVGHGGAVALLCLALAAAVSPALVAHNSSGDYHDTATVASVVHTGAMALWVGGLIAVALYAARRGRSLGSVTTTYSAVALGCYVMMATSGVMYAWINLSSLADLVTSNYGLILLGKIAVLVVLGYVGYQHRQRTLTMLNSGTRNAFRRLAGGEVTIMAVAVGLAVSLTRTDPPVPDDIALISPVRALIGYPIPPEISPWNVLTQIYPEALTAMICVAGAGLYIGGLVRLRKRGDSWPIGRTVSWFLGLGTLAFVQMSGMMSYGMIMLSVHMVQHMMLMMVVPVMLVLGSPITLALRSLKPAARGEVGPREMLTSVVQSGAARVLTNPLVAFALFVSGSFAVYYTGLFEAAMRNHTGHILMSLHFLIVGYLFFEVVIGVDPLPKRPPYLARIMMQLLAMGAHAVFGLGLTESAQLVAGSYYRELATDITWLPSPLDDQILAGQITMGFGELPGLIVVIIIFVQWYRADERDARRFDRRESDAEAERQAYNAYLADLDAKAQAADERTSPS